MSEQISEQISALLDGELPEAELSLLLRQIERQPSVLEQAYRIQQAHICSQGESPLALSEALNFSTSIHAAIREQDSAQTDQSFAIAALSQQTITNDSEPSLKNSRFSNSQLASNDSRWRPILGAGIAAAVAMVAVNAWQYQNQNPVDLESGTLEVSSNELPNFNAPAQIQALTSPLKASDSDTETSSYTVPNFEDLNTDTPVIPENDFRQVGYSDYLLQNSIAPQSTSKQLSRFAQEQRATIYQEQIYIDPRSGQIVVSIRPIID